MRPQRSRRVYLFCNFMCKIKWHDCQPNIGTKCNKMQTYSDNVHIQAANYERHRACTAIGLERPHAKPTTWERENWRKKNHRQTLENYLAIICECFSVIIIALHSIDFNLSPFSSHSLLRLLRSVIQSNREFICDLHLQPYRHSQRSRAAAAAGTNCNFNPFFWWFVFCCLFLCVRFFNVSIAHVHFAFEWRRIIFAT